MWNFQHRKEIAEMQAEVEAEEAGELELQADANIEEVPAYPEIPEIPNPVFEENIIEQAESPILSQEGEGEDEGEEDQNKIVSSFLQAEEQVNNLPNEQLQQPEIHLNLVQDPEIKAEIESNQVLFENQNEIVPEELSIHDNLRQASDNLYQLASFSEGNFKSPEIEPTREPTIENAKHYGAFGSKELEQTSQFAIQALNNIAYR